MRLRSGIKSVVSCCRILLFKTNEFFKKNYCSVVIYICSHYIEIFTKYLEKTYKKNATEESGHYSLIITNKYLLPSFKITSLYQLISPTVCATTGGKFVVYSYLVWSVPIPISRVINYINSQQETKYISIAKNIFDDYILPLTSWSAIAILANVLPVERGLILYWVRHVDYMHQKLDYSILSLISNDTVNILEEPTHEILKLFIKEPSIAMCKYFAFSDIEKSMSTSNLDYISSTSLHASLYPKLAKKFFCNSAGEYSSRILDNINSSLSGNNTWKELFVKSRREISSTTPYLCFKSFVKTVAQFLESEGSKAIGNPLGYYLLSPLRAILYDIGDVIIDHIVKKYISTNVCISTEIPELSDDIDKEEANRGYIKVPNTENYIVTPVTKVTSNLVCKLVLNMEDDSRVGGCFTLSSEITLTVTEDRNIKYPNLDLFFFSEDPSLKIVGASCI